MLRPFRFLTSFFLVLVLVSGFAVTASLSRVVAGAQIGKIFFTSERDGKFGIDVMNADGSNMGRLLDVDGYEPALSPDGRQVAFVLNGQIYVIDADGSNRGQLTTTGGHAPGWSPDGHQIAFAAGTFQNVYVMKDDGSSQHPLTDSMSKFLIQDVAWSPDGKYIAFSSEKDVKDWNKNSNIYVVNIDGSNIRRLTQEEVPERKTSWSPDSKHLAYVSDERIAVMDSDGSNGRRLTKFAGYDSPVWSPDGKQVTFTKRDEQGQIGIYIMDIDGSNQRLLVDGKGIKIGTIIGWLSGETALPTHVAPAITPATTDAKPTVSPTTTAEETTPALSGSELSVDGTWQGKTSQGKVISFTVEDQNLVALSVEFKIEGCGAEVSSRGSLGRIETNQLFSVGLSAGGTTSITISGKFDPNTSATGNIEVTGTQCGGFRGTWEATKQK